jgi:hypothetical protein
MIKVSEIVSIVQWQPVKCCATRVSVSGFFFAV